MSSGFYSKDMYFNLEFAPNAVFAPGFTLLKENKDSYDYPVEDWYWFDSRELAVTFLETAPPPFVIQVKTDRDPRVLTYESFMALFNEEELQLINQEKENNQLLQIYLMTLTEQKKFFKEELAINDFLTLLVKWNVISSERKTEILGVSQ